MWYCGALIRGARADVGPDLADLLVGDHAVPRGHLAFAVPHHLVEARLLLGAQQLEVRRRAGRVEPFAVTRRAMLRVHVASGVGRGLRARDAEDGHAGEERNAQDVVHMSACSLLWRSVARIERSEMRD